MKMHKRIFMTFVVIAIALVTIPLILGESGIFDDVLTIRIYNGTNLDDNSSGSVEIIVKFSSSEDNHNNQNLSLTFNLTTGLGFDKTFNSFDYRVIIDDTAENIDFFQLYNKCENERKGLDTGFNRCTLDLKKYEGTNVTTCQNDLSICQVQSSQKDSSLLLKEEDIKDLEDEEEETKNQKWFYGVIGVFLGVLAIMVYDGKIGRSSVKERASGEFQKAQAS